MGVLSGLQDDFSREMAQLKEDEATASKQYEVRFEIEFSLKIR